MELAGISKLLFILFGIHLLVEMDDEEPVGTDPADDVDIINDTRDADEDAADQAPARKNRKAAVVESDEEDDSQHREAELDVDAEAQGHDEIAAHDVNMAGAFGSESDDDGA